MKTLIYYEESKATEIKNAVVKITDTINRYTDKFNSIDFQLTTDKLKCLDYVEHSKQIIKPEYVKAIKDVCKQFGQNPELYLNIDYFLKSTNTMIWDISGGKIQPLTDFRNEVMGTIRIYPQLTDYIKINNNIAVIIPDAYKLIEESCKHYAQNSKQEKITKKLKEIQEIIKDIQQIDDMSARYIKGLILSPELLDYQEIERLA